jgi:hypothetical protein
MATTLNKVLREYANGSPTLAAGQWAQDQLTGRIHAMRRDGVTRDIFYTLSDISAALLSGSANTLQMANGAGAIGDSTLVQAGGALIQSYGQNGATQLAVQNTTSGTSSLAGLSLSSNGGLGAAFFLASSAYTDDAGAASRLNLSSGGFATGINLKGFNASDTIKTYFGATFASGNLYHGLSSSGADIYSAGTLRARIGSTGVIGAFGSNSSIQTYGVGDVLASNYEYMEARHNGAVAFLAMRKGGTGSFRNFQLINNGAVQYELSVAGSHAFNGPAVIDNALGGQPLTVKISGTEMLGVSSTGIPRLMGSSTTAALTATLTNSPKTGNPTLWLNVVTASGAGWIPVWT